MPEIISVLPRLIIRHVNNAPCQRMASKTRYTHFLKFWLPVYLYAALIFVHSSLSSPPIALKILHGDKLVHLIEYAIFGYLLGRAAKNSSAFKIRAHFRILAVSVAILYGLTDEFHQYFVPGRKADIFDVLADGVGAFLGQMLIR